MPLALTQARSLDDTFAVAPTGTPSLEALYATHAPSVWRWVRRLAGAGADVEDLVQEVFLRAHRALPSFRGESQDATWLYRITVRVVSRHRRSLRHGLAAADPPPGTARSPEDEAGSAEAEALLYRALDGLPERQRALLIAFELEELSGPQIAEALGIKQSTLWVQLHRARAALQKELERLHAH